MKPLFVASLLTILFSCNNSKKDKPAPGNDQPTTTTPTNNTTVPTTNNTMEPTSGAKFTIDGKEISLSGSLLVDKDKKKLKPGNDYLVMLTASGGYDPGLPLSLTLKFLMDLKPGTYPVVGMSMTHGDGEVYGGILGGEEKLTDYKVNITECKDLGSNNFGGHKWSISGTFDDLTIPAMGIMLLDKTKNHPKEIKVEKGSFFNLTFDDNMAEMLKKAMDQMKNN